MNRAYAKINLGLHVVERLPNGFHHIETAFVFLNWCDEIHYEHADSYELTSSDESLDVSEQNLVTRAVKLMEERVDKKMNLRIHLHKRIPSGAGLGGGSSDAAATLKAINNMWDLDIATNELMELGAQLGADVPIFLSETPAFASGIGTQLELAEIQPNAWILTIFPGIECPTAQVYQHCQPSGQPEISIKSVLLNDDLSDWKWFIQNDLEAPALFFHPQIGHIKDEMVNLGADFSLMTGSGSSVFGLFEQEFVALEALQSFRHFGYQANITEARFKPDWRLFRLE